MKILKLFAAVIAAVAASVAFAFSRNEPLFRIERSKNANIVQYDANIGADGNIDRAKPVDYYWLLHASDGSREEITLFQKKAYGFSVKYNEAGYFDMRMKAVEDRELKIFFADGSPKAEIMINGRKAYLSKIYIDSEDTFTGIPKVNYYTLTGNDAETGEVIEEKVAVKKIKPEEVR